MSIPLNIDWQQILLHLLNFTILAGGLYFLLYQPVKAFMDKRQAYYQELDRQAQEKLEQAEKLKVERQEQLDAVEQELKYQRAEVQLEIQKSTQAQIEESKKQAEQILVQARTSAEQEHQKMLRTANQELTEFALATAEKMVQQAQGDLYDQFLNTVEGGTSDEPS